jgi:methylated-DNA-[protein]-cysteine S-methyltransferase
LPLDLRGTEFQRRVWDALLAIPFGKTRTYAEVARAIAEPAAVRAVGAANGANPCAIVVPCHRVVASGGKLGGYGGGLPLKRRLLALEHATPLDGDLL